MANPWFRLYTEFADDPKVQMLSESMQRRLVMLFCEHGKDETLHETERAFQWRVTEDELAKTKALFVEKGFIDDEWNLCNWKSRQFISDSSTDRVRRYRRAKKQDETLHATDETKGNVTVTAPDTDTDTEQTHKPLASTAVAVPASPSVFTFPLTGKKTHIVTVADCDAWSAAYPAVDVRAELRRVLVWLDANEDKRSATVKGSKKRINTWLSRTQDAGGRNGTSKQFLSKSEQNAATFNEAAERIRSGALGTFDIFGRSPPIALAEECGPVHQRHPQLPSGGHSERDPGVVLEGETGRGDGVS